ncbi:MAG: hypothetical protein Ct9H300mP10_05860 [Methanobacteriota archaeon]|nr:MAG: hypothetical protein Ct9H300mP10_05860 [Euryarchaeota archaeon]
MGGGLTWENQTYNLSGVATELEEWEFHANGEHDLFVLNVRYQSAEGPDVDVAWHVREYSESLVPDMKTYLGQGDLDSTSGAGNDIRFDFASMGILPDGGAFIAYHDFPRSRPAVRRRDAASSQVRTGSRLIIRQL